MAHTAKAHATGGRLHRRSLLRHLSRPLLLLLLAAPAARAEEEEAREIVRGAEGARLFAVVERVYDDASALSVSVVRDGQPVLRKAFGLSDRTVASVATVHTLYDVGSVAKQFTAAAVLRLAEAGKLALDDSVRRFFPELPAQRDGITISHLLHHTAGISARPPRSLGGARSPEEAAERILGPDPIAPPGEKFEYSNAGYCLLAAVIEAASGTSFERYVKDAVFLPAGLKRTGFCQDDDLPGDLSAKRYGGADGTREIGSASYYAWGWGHRGCTGVVMDIVDLERWMSALGGSAVLTEASKEALFTPGAGGYSLGWFVTRSPRDTTCRHHGGATQGFSAHVASYPEDRISIVILCARQDLAPRLQAALEREILGASRPEGGVAVDPEVLARYAGIYDFPRGGGLEVRADDGGLSLVGVGQEPFSRLYYASGFKPQWLGLFERVNRRARQILPLLMQGDLEKARAVFLTPEAAAAGLLVFGRPADHEILGTDTGRDGMHTYLRLTAGDRVRGVTLAWGEEQRLRAVTETEGIHPFSMRLHPLTDTRFQGTGVLGSGTLRLEFQRDGSRVQILEPDGVGTEPIRLERR